MSRVSSSKRSVRTVGIFGPFELHLQSFHANLEAVHRLDGRLSAGRVVETYKPCDDRKKQGLFSFLQPLSLSRRQSFGWNCVILRLTKPALLSLTCPFCFMIRPLPSPSPLPLHHWLVSLSPKHLLWLVARSTNTLAEMTLPKGRNICSISESLNSWGRW